MKIQNDKCFYCGFILSELDNEFIQMDHFVPLSKNGIHSIFNLRYSCKSCNYSKHAKEPKEYLKQIGKEFLLQTHKDLNKKMMKFITRAL